MLTSVVATRAKSARPENGTIARVARERLGFAALRPGQREAIEAALDGRDVLAVMPTGAGKSAIYQIAAHLLPGPAVVVSPLIALQHDQVAALRARPLGDAVAVNSTSSPSRRQDALDDVGRGDVDFVFLSPEQLANRETLEPLRATRPALFVVDEAHCISHWGPDFRPWYLQLGVAAEALGRPPILALTATASPRVRADIVERLGMRRPLVVSRGFDRPNIRLEVVHVPDAIAKKNALVERVRLAETPGIVYAATRATVVELTAALAARGVAAVAYHAGLAAKAREAAQRDFMDGRIPVIVATNAFGLGIDKPDVRFVFHHDAPESLDAYYQEVGRAGRDGAPASAALFFAPDDLRLQRFFATGGRLRPRDVVHVASAVHETDGEVELDALHERLGVSKPKLTRILVELDRLGIVELVAGGRVRAGTPPADIAAVAERIAALDDGRRDIGLLQVELMRAYAEMDGCRRGFLLEHFGEPVEAACGRCDGCAARPLDAPPPRPRVVHAELGPGLVLNPVQGADDAVLVLFHSVGQKAVPLRELTVAGDRPDGRTRRRRVAPRRAVRRDVHSTRRSVSATHGLP